MLLQLIRKFDLFGKFYSSRFGQAWIRKKLRPVLPHLTKGQQHVDIGCGNGLIVESLRQQGYPCAAVDVADLSIVPEVKVTVYDGLHLPFEERQFDTALLLTVLHHTPDPIPVLEETARVAKRLVIIEDVYSNIIQQYMTYAMDTLVNLGHSSMTYQNKSDAGWKEAFEAMNWRIVAQSSQSILFFFRQATYVLEPIEAAVPSS
ncbi:MAG: class I SAM-dependent methyltransferase [Aureispira sp.]